MATGARSIMQFVENLSDRQAAKAVRARIDWKYALGLELTDSGFDFSVLSEFRQRLLDGGMEQQLLDRMLVVLAEHKLLKQLAASQSKHGIDLMAPVRPDVSWQARENTGYTIKDFKVDWDAQTVTCPQSVIATYWKSLVDS